MSRKRPRVTDYLDHIRAAIERIERYTAGLEYESFVQSDIAQDAVVRNLEIIGEACRNIARIDPDFAARHPDFPLKAALEMRNVLVHGYFGVDLEIVWRTIRTNLPPMRRQVEAIIAELGRD